MMADSDYSVLDQLLHRLALGYSPLADFLFDLDQIAVRRDPGKIVHRAHVFIAGLARAGTTMLTRQFHATRRYRSLTYRDMPFVLAPNLWRRLAKVSRREIARTERAHGDNIFVDVDSPESLDEVFWRVFSGRDYIRSDRLQPYMPKEEVIEKYVHYVNAVLATEGWQLDRYLSKNNNNVLRLEALRRAFPKALILVPFREPLQHSYSLFRQHLRFSELHARRPFALTYMTWLGHHEFGIGHRPFRFSEGAAPEYSAVTFEYWLHLWCEVYSWIESAMPSSTVLLCYEDLCSSRMPWRRLAELADVPEIEWVEGAIGAVRRDTTHVSDKALIERAENIYARLLALSRSRLS